MVRTQFITAAFLKDNTLIENNVDDAKINPLIFKAQDIHLAPLLGSDFYNHLQKAAAANPTTLNQLEKDLIADYIQLCVCEWTYYMSINLLRSKTTNKSLSQESSQYSTVAERQDAIDIRNELRDNAEFYSTRLVKYLCDHSESFPLYNNPTDKENLSKNSKTYFSGMYLPGGDCDGCQDGDQYRNR